MIYRPSPSALAIQVWDIESFCFTSAEIPLENPHGNNA